MLQSASQAVPAPPVDDVALTELVELARQGDLDAFDALFHFYTTRICTYLARMVGTDEEGRDLAQETFLRAWRNLPGMRESARFGPWLYRIATNMALDYLRTQRLRRWLPWPGSANEQQAESNATVQLRGPEEGVIEAEQVQQALAQVAPKYRACLLLRIEGGFSLREVASLLHLSEKSISIYVQRGGEQFRQAYQRLEQQTTEEERTDA